MDTGSTNLTAGLPVNKREWLYSTSDNDSTSLSDNRNFLDFGPKGSRSLHPPGDFPLEAVRYHVEVEVPHSD